MMRAHLKNTLWSVGKLWVVSWENTLKLTVVLHTVQSVGKSGFLGKIKMKYI